MFVVQEFFLSSTEAQQSYLQGFSKNILEASFDVSKTTTSSNYIFVLPFS